MLHTISTDQLLAVWSHLLDAEYGKASHGNEAEIYAYSLQPRSPGLELSPSSEFAQKVADEMAYNAARALIEIANLFQTKRKVALLIDGHCIEWWFQNLEMHPFDHRVKVEVLKGDRAKLFLEDE